MAEMAEIWKPNVVVAALVQQDNRFLLVEEETTEGVRLNQPAGHWEEHETLLEAVKPWKKPPTTSNPPRSWVFTAGNHRARIAPTCDLPSPARSPVTSLTGLWMRASSAPCG